MPLPAAIEQPTREQHRVSLEPVPNAIASMMLLTKAEEMPGVITSYSIHYTKLYDRATETTTDRSPGKWRFGCISQQPGVARSPA